MIGPQTVHDLYTFFQSVAPPDSPISRIMIHRMVKDVTARPENHTDYHIDNGATVMTTFLNDGYVGGQMTYVNATGTHTMLNEAGKTVVHDAGLVHGVNDLYGTLDVMVWISDHPMAHCLIQGKRIGKWQ